MPSKKGVLLVNLGTPLSPKPKDVYKYLIEFLTDGRVVDIPWLTRQFLVRGLIVPRRYKNSAASYKEIWTDEGSPLMVYSMKSKDLLQKSLGDDFHIELAMRYQQPSIKDALKKLEAANLKQLVVLPLFPQYASATTGSVHQEVMRHLGKWNAIPTTKFIGSFYNEPLVIKAFAENALKYNLNDYDHFLFSFHGLPERQLNKADKNKHCLKAKSCCKELCRVNRGCYSAQCHHTARLIQEQLGLSDEKVSLCFQSRLGSEPWLQPYAVDELKKLATEGKKNVLVFSPAFVADCLETIYEVSVEYNQEFKHLGGHKLDLVEGLNVNPTWIKAMQEIIVSS
ncbi:MAG: ferrochelatase [Parachlamydiales bacterium]|jgi:ferrochelatase